MDEEKTIDEAVEEQADEMKEFEPVAFDEVIKDEPVKESAPVLRALGDPEPADMNMIHKHVDNFLAKIAGETPIDENVRDSTEYWLKRLAEGNGGSTKKIYVHYVVFVKQVSSANYLSIATHLFNNNPEPYADYDDVKDVLFDMYAEAGATIRLPFNGVVQYSEGQLIVSHSDISDKILVFGGVVGGIRRSVDITTDTNINIYDAVFPIN